MKTAIIKVFFCGVGGHSACDMTLLLTRIVFCPSNSLHRYLINASHLPMNLCKKNLIPYINWTSGYQQKNVLNKLN